MIYPPAHGISRLHLTGSSSRRTSWKREPKLLSRRSWRDGGASNSRGKSFLFTQVRLAPPLCGKVFFFLIIIDVVHLLVAVCVCCSDLATAAGPKQEVICLDSSGDEGEEKEAPPPQLPAHRDGKFKITKQI